MKASYLILGFTGGLALALLFAPRPTKAAPVPLSQRKKSSMTITHPDIERLAQLMPPPDKLRRVPTREHWAALESRMGTAMPDDYKAFLTKYGDVMISNSIWFVSPCEENEYYTDEHPETKGLTCLEQHSVHWGKFIARLRQKFPEQTHFALGDPSTDYYGKAADVVQMKPWPGEDTILLIGRFPHARCNIGYRVKGPPNEWTIVAGNERDIFKEYPMGLGKWLILMVEKPDEAKQFYGFFYEPHPSVK